MKSFKFGFLIWLASSVASAAPIEIKSVSGKHVLTGNPVAVTAESKKGMVVVFLSAKCPCSNSHVSELKELSSNYSGFSFVAVHSNTDESSKLSQPYFQTAALPFPVIEDQGSELADRLRAAKTPHAFVFKPDGTIAYQGGVSNSKDCAKADRKYLREALEDLEAGNKVRTAEGRALGCAITRGEKHAP